MKAKQAARAKSKRRLISIPENVDALIVEAAEAEGTSVSHFIARHAGRKARSVLGMEWRPKERAK